MNKIKDESQIKYGERLGDASSIINNLDSKKEGEVYGRKSKTLLLFFSFMINGNAKFMCILRIDIIFFHLFFFLITVLVLHFCEKNHFTACQLKYN